MRDPDVNLAVAILVVVAMAGAVWFFREGRPPRHEPPIVELPQTVVEDVDSKEVPKYPVTPTASTDVEQVEAVPLPPLDESDGLILDALVDIFGANVEVLLVQEALIDKFVATVDNLPRDHVAEKIRPTGRLSERFRVDAAGGDGPIYLSPDNYKRYDPLVGKIAAADIDAVVDTYRRFYPLLQQSYERLGYPGGYFNDRVIEVIDHLLEAPPQPDEPIPLVRPHVLYEFADAQLEALSSGQKLLLRVGPRHAAIVRQFLRDLRVQLASQ